tara:strand:+ start:37 stop:225 length:189 start_codon:yes stop_codon:yes gene_type:complete
MPKFQKNTSAFRMKGFSGFKEERRLKKDLKDFEKQYKKNPSEDTHKDLKHARQAWDEYVSGA